MVGQHQSIGHGALQPPSPPGPARQHPGLVAYRALTRLAQPAAGLILRYRMRRGKEDPVRLGERLGVASVQRPAGALAWIHAASVGEANSVLPLVAALCERRPDLTVLLTTGTVTSARAVAPRLGARAIHQYVPLDGPQLVGRFLDHWRPDLAVLTEQEIWPNLVLETRARGIALALVNARMSEASFQRWQRRPAVAGALFSSFAVTLGQSEEIAARLRALGAGGAAAIGNLKIDAPPPPVDAPALVRLETALAGRPRLLAASTHEGEEAVLVAAHRELARRLAGFCTIIAPRHPDRGPALAERFAAEGLRVRLRSTGALPDAQTDIYLADTIGELGTLYATSPVAFVGGSLIPHGGQNPIEAVRRDAVVLTGPSWSNFAEPYRALLASGGAIEVHDATEIATRVAELIGDPVRIARMRANAQSALSELGGALERTLAALLPLLPPVPLAMDASGVA